MQRELASRLLRLPLIGTFPPIIDAFAYGSAVFSQQSGAEFAAGQGRSDDASKMVDLIFVVDDAVAWHDENVRRRPHDYSSFGRWLFGGGGGSSGCASTASPRPSQKRTLAAAIQRAGGGLWYNAAVQLPSPPPNCAKSGAFLRAKYGVVEMTDAVRDLTAWTSLYVAGRLQKPVLPLAPQNQSPKINAMRALLHAAFDANRRSAMQTAMLLVLLDGAFSLNKAAAAFGFSMRHLLREIVALSFLGDLRMRIGEHPQKRENILAGQSVLLCDIYLAALKSEYGVEAVSYDALADRIEVFDIFGVFVFYFTVSFARLPVECFFFNDWRRFVRNGRRQIKQNVHRVKQAIVDKLPSNLHAVLASSVGHNESLSVAALSAEGVRHAIASVVWWPAIVQGAKGLLSVSPATSREYMWRKLKKKFA